MIIEPTALFADRVAIYRKLSAIIPGRCIEALMADGIESEGQLRDYLLCGKWRRTLSRSIAAKLSRSFGLSAPEMKSHRVTIKPSKLAERVLARMRGWTPELRIAAGLYALTYRGRVMYIGQTINVLQRIGQHLATKPKFDGVLFIEMKRAVTPARLLHFESILLSHLVPPWN